jgi:hypothetical protein
MFQRKDTQSFITRKLLMQMSTLDSITGDCTHLIVPFLRNQEMEQLFKFKIAHRNIKTIYNLDASTLQDIGVKAIVKLLVEGGFDGIIVDNVHLDSIQCVFKLFNIMDKLPPPYNFIWTKLLAISNEVQNVTFYKELLTQGVIFVSPTSLVKKLTDIGIPPASIVLNFHDQAKTNIEIVKYAKLGGLAVYNNDDCNMAFGQLKNTLENKENHLEYPTSTMVRNIVREFSYINDNAIVDIIESYTNEPDPLCKQSTTIYNDKILTIMLNIDFI